MRFSLLFILSLLLRCLTAQPGSAKSSDIYQMLENAEAKLDASDYNGVNEILQLLESRIDSNTPPQTRYAYHKLNGMRLFAIRNIPEAQNKFRLALKIAKELNDSVNIALVTSELGNTYTLQGAYKEALEHYNISLSYFPEKNSSYTNTLMNMSLTYKGLNQYDKALSVLTKGRIIYENAGDYRSLGTLENNIGEIYRDHIKDLNQARNHYHRAIVANKKAKSEAGLAQNYHNLAAMFLDLKNTDSALYHARLSMQIKENLSDEGGLASANYILGDVYFQKGNHPKAIRHFNQSLELSKQYQLMEGIYYNSLRLGQLYQKQGDFSQSEPFLLVSKDVAEGSEDLQIIGASYKQLYELYKEKGDYKRALKYNEKLQNIGDSLSKLRTAQNLDELRTQYEADLAKSENLILREKEKAQEANISSQRNLLYISVASIVLLLLSAVWLISILRQRNRALTNEQQSKAELEIQHLKLKESEDRLQKTNDLKNRILSVLGHDLRNPLNNISTLLGAVSSADLKENDFTEVLGFLQKETDVSQIILQEILAWARLQMDEEGKIIETINAKELIAGITTLHSHSARQKGIRIHTSGSSIELSADRNQMKSVFSNLVFNAIKFSKKNSAINIDIEEDNQKAIFRITDSGKGIDPKVLENLNKRHRVISESGTGGERGTGIGLRIVNDFVEAHGGTLQFRNNEEAGATVTVIIPLQQEGSNQTLQLQNQ